MPFPNLNAIKKDIAFYRDHHVRGFFAQGSYQSTGGDMAELNAWLIAKLLWNPDANADALVADFVKGFYGPAAPAMTEYFNLLHDQVKSNKYHAHLYSPPSVGYMDAELLDKMDKALTLAAEQAKGDQLASEHVRKARIGYTYTLLAAPEIFCPKDKPHCEKNRNLFKVFNDFQAELEHFGISNLNEWQPTSETLKKLRLSSLGWKE